jgi:hypothetical protein
VIRLLPPSHRVQAPSSEGGPLEAFTLITG